MGEHGPFPFVQPILAVLAGLIILIAPSTLPHVVAVYLILAGLTGLIPHLFGS